MHSYAAGFSILTKKGIQFDLGFDYLVGKEVSVPNNSSDLMNSTDPFKPVYNPYAGLDYHQQTETYIGAFKMTMPWEVMTEMMHHSLSLLNPFD
jgi:hypothetical protein